MGQNIHPSVLEDFLEPKVTTPQIWGSVEISKLVAYICLILSPRNFYGLRGYSVKIEKIAKKKKYCLS